jgi:DNA mismatch repair protein MutS
MKQIALIVILAQIGSFVPSSSASINIRKRILSRLGTSDDMENNLSTFSIEMRECAYIIDNADQESLVLIDELGRGTGYLDGNDIVSKFSLLNRLYRIIHRNCCHRRTHQI